MYGIREDVGHTYSTRLRRTGRWAASKESEGRAESRKRMKYSSDRDQSTAKAVNRHHCFGHGTRSQAFEWAHGTTDGTAYFRCPRFHSQYAPTARAQFLTVLSRARTGRLLLRNTPEVIDNTGP